MRGKRATIPPSQRSGSKTGGGGSLPSDIRHYCRVVRAIAGTLVVQEKIDGLYPGIEEQFEI
ncbi:MAG TPA: hypothetical protein VMT62_03520 [Syntrophorhabdaceae bacterium]|nr:hypothetical protein [Syntrophorhabdaceae bacterium]